MQQGGLGRHSHPGHSSGAGSPAFLEEDGALPGQCLVGIRVDPITPCVLLAPVKHVIILATLKRLAQRDIFTSKEAGFNGLLRRVH